MLEDNLKEEVAKHEEKYDAVGGIKGRGLNMALYSGKPFYPLDPSPDEVDIQDIAHSLSMTTRYGGHAKSFYTVAQHSVILSNIVSKENAFVALMHDATEAYIGDLIRPIKYMLPKFIELEENIWRAVALRYNLPIVIPDEVKFHDTKICFTERNCLMNHTGETDWGHEVEPHDFIIEPWSQEKSYKMFIKRFEELYSEK